MVRAYYTTLDNTSKEYVMRFHYKLLLFCT